MFQTLFALVLRNCDLDGGQVQTVEALLGPRLGERLRDMNRAATEFQRSVCQLLDFGTPQAVPPEIAVACVAAHALLLRAAILLRADRTVWVGPDLLGALVDATHEDDPDKALHDLVHREAEAWLNTENPGPALTGCVTSHLGRFRELAREAELVPQPGPRVRATSQR